jgi:hypothetical protein
MTLFTRQHLSAASAGVALTLVAGGGAFLASSQASTTHQGARAGVNAATLNGYTAKQLTKVTSVQDATPVDNFQTTGCTFVTIKSLTVKNPTKGYLLVTATVGAARDTDFPDTAELATRLKLGSKLSGASATQLTSDGDYDGNVTVQATFPVKKGKDTVNLQATANCDTGNTAAAYIDNRTITAQFVPFGSSNVIAARPVATPNR